MRGKPSELIRRHLQGAGNGFELDDLMSERTDSVYEEIARIIVELHERFKTPEYPIGTSNPASFQSLEDFADDLQRRGL
jgi:hypothetical protein